MNSDPIGDINTDALRNIDAEKVILGAILLDNAYYYECDGLDPSFFCLDWHRRIYVQIGQMVASRMSVDFLTLTNELSRKKQLKVSGGLAYIAGLIEGLPQRPAIKDYVRILRENHLLRQTMSICSDGLARAAAKCQPPEILVADLDRQLLKIARGSVREQSLESQTQTAFEELEAQRAGRTNPWVSTGLESLDGIIGGFQPKKLYIIGGRPSMGKTSIMIQAAIQHCVQDVRTRLVSLEMTSVELLQRIFAAVSTIPFEKVSEPQLLSNDDWEKLDRACAYVKRWPLEIDDRGDQTVDSVLAGCRLSVRLQGTRFVALDYIQNLRFASAGTLRHQEISDAAKQIREFAKVEGVPVLMLSSITETSEKNPNKRPSMADLRGSGDLAFHADTAALIHRKRTNGGASIDVRTEIVVAKQRGGRTGVAHVRYNSSTLLFEDL